MTPSSSPKIELLWWEGCPSWERALENLSEVMRELGLDPSEILVREVDGEEAARTEEFYGSPTIKVNGKDIQPPRPKEHVGLACRIYHLRDGRVSPTPDPEDVKDVLVEATGERSKNDGK